METMSTATVLLTVRYFAAARAAAGTETETVRVGAGHDGRGARRHPRRARSGARPGAATVLVLM